MIGSATVIRGNALHIPLPDASVDLICTSPPYFGLRSYQDAGAHYQGQIGSEATPAEFLDALIAATREMVRVLKPSGSLFVNLGDKYGRGSRTTVSGSNSKQGYADPGRVFPTGQDKSLLGIPWRYAIACIDQLGLILRAEIIWSKPNGLPESVTDRVRRSHEQWFYFQQSGNEVVEAGSHSLPFCPLCGRPKDARATLVQRLHELDASIQDGDLADQVGPDERVNGERGVSPEQPGVVGLGSAPVPFAVPGDSDLIEDAGDIFHDWEVTVEDHDSEMGAARSAVAEDNTALAVDDSSQPGEVCSCSHPFILDDEPWIPQSVAADIMQGVADGEIDPQHAADFLSGNYARTHSTWFHFTKQPRYFAAVDEIRESHAPETAARYAAGYKTPKRATGEIGLSDRGIFNGEATAPNPLGKLPGSVWTVPTQPLEVPPELGVDHFAAYPMEWPRRIIQGWTPIGICVECGEGRRPIRSEGVRVGVTTMKNASTRLRGGAITGGGYALPGGETWQRTDYTITGYACGCLTPTAPTRPSVCLDPFGGTGTTALVAKALGRHGITIDLSADYCRLAQWRCNNPQQLAAALQVEKPDVIPLGQMALFD